MKKEGVNNVKIVFKNEEEIREKRLLTISQIEIKRHRKNFFGIETNRYDLITESVPMRIEYNLDSIIAVFDECEISNGNTDGYESYQKYSKDIVINKNNEIIELQYCGGTTNFNILSSNPDEIVAGIAKVVALKQISKF